MERAGAKKTIFKLFVDQSFKLLLGFGWVVFLVVLNRLIFGLVTD